MPGRAGDDPASQGPPQQREVPHHVEDLVADELVREAKLAVHHAVLPDQDAVVEASPRGETRGRELRELVDEAERPGGSDLVAEGFRSPVLEDVALLADRSPVGVAVTGLTRTTLAYTSRPTVTAAPAARAPVSFQPGHRPLMNGRSIHR